MKKIILVIATFSLFFINANAAEKKDCSVHKKMLDKIKCRADNLKKKDCYSTHSTNEPEFKAYFLPSLSTTSSF